jgi:hypothetical protein
MFQYANTCTLLAANAGISIYHRIQKSLFIFDHRDCGNRANTLAGATTTTIDSIIIEAGELVALASQLLHVVTGKPSFQMGVVARLFRD